MKKNTSQITQSDLPRLSAPAQRALAAAGVGRLMDLTGYSEAQVARWHGIGPNALRELRSAMAAAGLSFATVETRQKG